jgi:hypothetical protein
VPQSLGTVDEDGMYGRFLYGWPAQLDYRPLVDNIEEVDPAFQNMLIHLIRLPAEDSQQQSKWYEGSATD